MQQSHESKNMTVLQDDYWTIVSGGDGNDYLTAQSRYWVLGGDGIDSLGLNLWASENISFVFEQGESNSFTLADGTKIDSIEYLTHFGGGVENDDITIPFEDPVLIENYISGYDFDGRDGQDSIILDLSDTSSNLSLEFYHDPSDPDDDRFYISNDARTFVTTRCFEEISVIASSADDTFDIEAGDRTVQLLDGSAGVDTLLLDKTGETSDLSLTFEQGVSNDIALGDGTLIKSMENLTEFIGGNGDDVINYIFNDAYMPDDIDSWLHLYGGEGTDSITLDFSKTSNSVDARIGSSIINANPGNQYSIIGKAESISFIGSKNDDDIYVSRATKTPLIDGGDGFDSLKLYRSDATTDLIFTFEEGAQNSFTLSDGSNFTNIEHLVEFLGGEMAMTTSLILLMTTK